jgi:hypothetical protein
MGHQLKPGHRRSLRPAKPRRYDERNTSGAELELEHIAALRQELATPAFVIS